MASGGMVAVGIAALVGIGAFLFGGKKTKAAPGQGGGTARGYPWNKYSVDTLSLQKEINAVLRDKGLGAISEDGRLGGETCGAAQYVSDQFGVGVVPATCREFTWQPVTSGGKSYDTWNLEIESKKNSALATANYLVYAQAAKELRSWQIPFPDLKAKALIYAEQLDDMAEAAQVGGGGYRSA